MNLTQHLIDRDYYDNLAGVPPEGRVCYVSEELAKQHGSKLMGYRLQVYKKCTLAEQLTDATIRIKHLCAEITQMQMRDYYEDE